MFRLTTLMLCVAGLSAFAGDVYKFDTAHSSILFNVAHQQVGMQWGRFNTFDGSIEFDGDTPKSFNVTIEADSIDSGNAKRDGHLRKPDFFNAAEFPKVTFTSTKIEVMDGGALKVTGDLEMVGVKKSVTFDLKHMGPVDGRGGAKIRGVHGTTTIKRSDYGMTYGMGGIGDEVTITVALEVVHK